MDRRKYLRERRRMLLQSWLRNLLVIALLVAAGFGVRYVWQRSASEIAKVLDRPENEYYMVVDQPVGMTVVNEDGELSMEITGEEVRLTSDQKTAIFIGAEAVYYEDGEESLTMSAGQIEYDTDTEDFLLTGGLSIETKDGMSVAAPTVEWRRNAGRPNLPGYAAKVPSFRFREGVDVVSRDGNTIKSNYMQADRDLMYMEFVGNVSGQLAKLEDTEFITERELTDVDDLNLDDFEKLSFSAETVIYDKRNEVVLATSRSYERSFQIMDMDGQPVDVALYQDKPQQVTFAKKEITIETDHLEAHIARQWAECFGNINMVVPPDEPEEGDDRALKSMKQFTTYISTSDVEYFWGRDYVLTHGRTRVEQEDRLAVADAITYWGDEKMVFLEGDITMVQGQGGWLFDDELVQVEDHDMERALRSYSEMYADRAVMYLNNNDFIASGGVLVRQDERETAADTIVYQDEIKRINADGNVKFRDRDGQVLLCNALVFHNESDFMEIQGGASATLRIPAEYANDINRTLAETREEEVPPEIEDPPQPGEPPSRNPNALSNMAAQIAPAQVPEQPVVPPAGDGAEALPLPGNGSEPLQVEGSSAEELLLELGEAAEGESAEEPEEEPEAEPAGSQSGQGQGGSG